MLTNQRIFKMIIVTIEYVGTVSSGASIPDMSQ